MGEQVRKADQVQAWGTLSGHTNEACVVFRQVELKWLEKQGLPK